MPGAANSDRVTMQETAHLLNISIPAKFDLYVFTLLAIICALNLGFLVSSVRNRDLTGLVWAWVVFVTARAMIWNVRGCEKISINDHVLQIRFEMPGMSTTSNFDLSDVDTLRTFNYRGVRRLWSFAMLPDQRGTIVFDYKGKVRAFGADLSQEEAENVLRHIEQYSGFSHQAR